MNNRELRYKGYFLMDSGLKISFDISEEDGGEEFYDLYNNSEFNFEKEGMVWLGEESDLKILVDKIVGFEITTN